MTASGTPAKQELRARVSGARRAMSPHDREVAAATITRVVLGLVDTLSAATVATYLSVGTEPATIQLVDVLRAAGVRVLAPVLRDDLDLDWAQYVGADTLAQGPLGLRAPTGHRLGLRAVGEADLVLVPALAVDGAGNRLGRGGGSYDRALARVPAARPVVALLYDGEVLRAVPSEPHDRRVTAAITPSRTHQFA